MAIALMVTVGALSVRGISVQSLALEQEVRCGIPAHTHSSACYDGHDQVCGMEEHGHSRNCYLILLEDNNINNLLVQMAYVEGNSLEAVIGQTVDNALVYNTNLTSPLAEGTTLEDVAELNRTVEENNVQPAVVFNENIQTMAASSGDLLGAALPSTGGGASTLALGDSANGNAGKANFYVHLDGGWKIVGVLDFQPSKTPNKNNRYTVQLQTQDILNLYNGALGTELTASDLNFVYCDNTYFSSYNTRSDSVSGIYTQFGTDSPWRRLTRSTRPSTASNLISLRKPTLP